VSGSREGTRSLVQHVVCRTRGGGKHPQRNHRGKIKSVMPAQHRGCASSRRCRRYWAQFAGEERGAAQASSTLRSAKKIAAGSAWSCRVRGDQSCDLVEMLFDQRAIFEHTACARPRGIAQAGNAASAARTAASTSALPRAQFADDFTERGLNTGERAHRRRWSTRRRGKRMREIWAHGKKMGLTHHRTSHENE